jgi:predicted RNA binding protein YcfA (HicA-like mRNA interferase family)
MPKLPRVTETEVLAALRRDGWHTVTQRGSHVQLRHDVKPGRVTVPVHHGQVLRPHLLSSILKQAGLSADEFRALL